MSILLIQEHTCNVCGKLIENHQKAVKIEISEGHTFNTLLGSLFNRYGQSHVHLSCMKYGSVENRDPNYNEYTQVLDVLNKYVGDPDYV